MSKYKEAFKYIETRYPMRLNAYHKALIRTIIKSHYNVSLTLPKYYITPLLDELLKFEASYTNTELSIVKKAIAVEQDYEQFTQTLVMYYTGE